MTFRRALSLGLILGVALMAGLAAAAWWWSGRIVPSLQGRAQLGGLDNPVNIEFDRYAIPHVYARGARDVWTAIGYLHGRERLWQMELYRRAGSGRLAELFGEATLPVDRRFRRLGLRRAAEAELSRATPEVRAALERYALGVNAAIQAAGEWSLPLEFLALRTRPEYWTPVDSLTIGKLMSWRLGENRLAELVRYRLAGMLTGAQVAQLMGTSPSWAPVIVGDERAAAGPKTASDELLRPIPAAVSKPLVVSRFPKGLEWLASGGRALSNSWVVSGARTATGRPLLANDPHLAVEMPAIWYEAHFIAADLDVSGVTIPGIPFIIIGHNQRIGWGLTSVGIDVQDLYVERVDVERRRYLNRGSWVPLKVERHQILVWGRDPVVFEVLLTERGPIANAEEWDEPPPPEVEEPVLSDQPLSLRWDVIMQGDTAGTFEALGRAANWEEFLAAAHRLGSPGQNFVYADVDGNIGYAMSGLVPVRSSHDGSAPSSGSTGDGSWRGFIDPTRLPTAFNPPGGAVVAANNEVDRRFGSVIVRDWVAPFRALRIRQLLDGQTDLDLEAFQRIQADLTSAAAELILPAIESAATAPRQELSGSARAALDRMRLWDRRVDGRGVVALYETFLAAFWRRTFIDQLGASVFQSFYEWAARERYAGLYMIIGDLASPWWDDVATIDKKESRDDVVALAAEDAMRTLSRRFGAESEWAWDRLHAVKFAHPLAAGGLLFDRLFSRGPVPIAGDGDTVNKTMIDLAEPYVTTELASYRQILDVGAWDNSVGVITTGQSGHPRSPHYFDQNPLWREGRYHTLPYSRRAVVSARESQLLLVP